MFAGESIVSKLAKAASERNQSAIKNELKFTDGFILYFPELGRKI